MNTLERSDWLESLQPGTAVVFAQPNFGPLTARVRRMCTDKIWLVVDTGFPADPEFEVWVWRETGDCPANRTAIQPTDAVLPTIGGEPDAGRIGGWEAA